VASQCRLAICALITDEKGFGINDILIDAGINKNSIECGAAAKYARRIMHTMTMYPASVLLPRPTLGVAAG
jgi:hypothetical protein